MFRMALVGLKIRTAEIRRRVLALLPSWSGLRGLSRSRALSSSYIWLLIVPLLAKALEHVPSNIEWNLWGDHGHLSLTLPFSWVDLFFCALALSLGNLVFLTRCPKLVREFESFTSFQQSRVGFEYLRRVWELPHESGVQDLFPLEGQRVLEVPAPALNRFMDLAKSAREGTSSDARPPVNDDELAVFFWGFYWPLDKARPLSRLACAALYGIGFLFMALMLAQNLHFVMRHFPGVWPRDSA